MLNGFLLQEQTVCPCAVWYGEIPGVENYLAMNYKKAGTVLIKDNGSLGIPRYPMPGMERPVWIPAHIVFTRKPLLYTTP